MSDPAPRAGRFRRMSAGLRQRSFPAEFRIAPPAWPPELHDVLRRIERVRAAARAVGPPATGPVPAARPVPAREAVPPDLDDGALVDAVIGVWRTQRRLDAAGADGGALARQLRRHLNGAWDGLAKLEVRTQVHDDRPFNSGMTVEVLAIEPRAGLTREMIIETVRPTIYRSDRVIAMGQVIVGRPERPTDT